MASEAKNPDNTVASTDVTNPNDGWANGGIACAVGDVGGSTATYNFIVTPFALPAGANITGLRVDIKWGLTDADDSLTVELQDVNLVWRSKAIGNRQAGSCGATASDQVGLDGDLWGGDWTEAHIESADFQVRWTNVASAKAADTYVDSVLVTVYYTVGGATVNVTISTDGITHGEPATTPSHMRELYRTLNTEGYSLHDAITKAYLRSVWIVESDIRLADAFSHLRTVNWTIPTEVLLLGEVLITRRELYRSLSSRYSLADAIDALIAVPVSLADYYEHWSHIGILVNTYIDFPGDAYNLSDSPSLLRSLYRTLVTEGLTLYDLVAAGVPGGVPVNLTVTTEDIRLADALTVLQWNRQLITDSFTLGDVFSHSRLLYHIIDDTYEFSDSPSTLALTTITQSILDALTLSDSLSYILSRMKFITEALTLADSPSHQRSLYRTMTTDRYDYADSISAIKWIVVALLDASDLSEFFGLVKTDVISLASALSLTDSLSHQRGLYQTLATDRYDYADDFSLAIAATVKLWTVLTLADAISSIMGRGVPLTDALTLRDLPTLTRLLYRTVATEGLTLADSLVSYQAMTASPVDGLTLADSLGFLFARTLDLQENLTLADQILAQLIGAQNVSLTSALTHADILSRLFLRFANITEGYLITDTLSLLAPASIYQTITDAFTHGDSVSMSKTVSLLLRDTFELLDDVGFKGTVSLALRSGYYISERPWPLQIAVVTVGVGVARTYMTIAQYLNYLATGKLPDDSIAEDG